VRYVLVGEGPYPRPESATGVCFMDGAVGELWSETGLSKPVNRATSLRNFMKMLLVADGQLNMDDTGGAALAPIAKAARAGGAIQTLAELQDKLIGQGFLLLNASLVFRKHVAPVVDAAPGCRSSAPCSRRWGSAPKPTLVLWGKIAEQLKKGAGNRRLPADPRRTPLQPEFHRPRRHAQTVRPDATAAPWKFGAELAKGSGRCRDGRNGRNASEIAQRHCQKSALTPNFWPGLTPAGFGGLQDKPRQIRYT
jgi:uracil DNA glycosylase